MWGARRWRWRSDGRGRLGGDVRERFAWPCFHIRFWCFLGAPINTWAAVWTCGAATTQPSPPPAAPILSVFVRACVRARKKYTCEYMFLHAYLPVYRVSLYMTYLLASLYLAFQVAGSSEWNPWLGRRRCQQVVWVTADVGPRRPSRSALGYPMPRSQ